MNYFLSKTIRVQNRHFDQWNQNEYQDTNPYTNGTPVFAFGFYQISQKYTLVIRQHLQQIIPVSLATCIQKNPNRFILIALKKIQFQLVRRCQDKTRDTEFESRENILELTGRGKKKLKRTLLAEALIQTGNEQDLRKLKRFYMANGTIIQTKRRPTECEKILPNTHLLEGKYQKSKCTKILVHI